MSDKAPSRFATQSLSADQRLSTNTVGLVALSDFRKRRAEVLEQQERDSRDAAFSGTSTPDRSLVGTPDNVASDSAADETGARPLKKKKKKQGKKLLSFGDDEDEDGGHGDSSDATANSIGNRQNGDGDGTLAKKSSIKANTAVGIIPKAVTKSALRKEAAEREALRREFVALQDAVKATEIAIPFVFYDGAHTPGGIVRMKKGDFVWLFLDKSRKVGAELGVGEGANALRSWARVGVDDLMLVRGTVIIPHHYDFYFFVANKSVGPGGRRLFDYSYNAPSKSKPTSADQEQTSEDPLSTAASRAAAAAAQTLPDVNTLEGAAEDPMETKVVDRRWYERNKHIYPASTWQEFDPEKDYETEVRKDTGGNTFFFSR